MRMPRGSTRSVKYVVDSAPASETAGTQQFILAVGTDNDSPGQASAVDTAVPVGSKITTLDLRVVFGNLVAVNDFIHWTIQKKGSGQGNVTPESQGGNPLRNNVMLSGLTMVGKEQNKTMHIKYSVPKKFWRMKDGDTWVFVYTLSEITTASKQVVYKIFL